MSPARDESILDRVKDELWLFLFQGHRAVIAAVVVFLLAMATMVGLGYYGVAQARKAADEAVGASPDTRVAQFAPAMLDALGCVSVVCPDSDRTTAFLAARSSSQVMQVVIDGQATQLVPGAAQKEQWVQFAQAATLWGAVSSQTIQVDPRDSGDVARFTVPGTTWRGAMTFTRDGDGLRLTRLDYLQEPSS